MDGKTLMLCRPCAELMRDGGYLVRVVRRGVDKKITCDNCRKRRFGAECVVTLRRRTDAGKK